MKKFVVGTILWTLAMVVPMSAMAKVDVHVSIPLPPPIVFAAPPSAVVIPETYVYTFPDVQEEIFFYNGWWWRSWGGRWYRSRHYNSGWVHYKSVPSFYSKIPSNWRNDYRDHRWKGYRWNYQRIPQNQLQNNWKSWERNKYWEKQHSWGVKELRHRQPPQAQHPRDMNPPSPPKNSPAAQPRGHYERGGYDRPDGK
jgi:hypothetical protein